MYNLVISESRFPTKPAERENYKNLGFFCDTKTPGNLIFFFIKYRIFARFKHMFTLLVISLNIPLVFMTKNKLAKSSG